MDDVQKAFAKTMENIISDISEDFWCAGWMRGIEEEIWKMVIGETPIGYDEDKILALKELNKITGLWPVWKDGVVMEERTIPEV